MKCIPILLFGLSCTYLSLCQQRKLDSLRSELNKHSQEDSIKLKLMLAMARGYSDVNGDKGITLALEAIQLAKKLQAKKLEGTAYTYAAQNYQTLGKDSFALRYCLLSLKLKQELNDSIGIAGVYHTMGMSYFNMSDYYDALKIELSALQIFTLKRDSVKRAIALNSLGVDYQYLGNYPEAMQNYQLAAEIWTNTGSLFNAANAFTNIGLIYKNLGNYGKALDYHKKSLAFHEREDETIQVADNYGNIGNVYDLMNDTFQARIYFRKALEISQKGDYQFGIASATANLGVSYANSKEYDKAIPNLHIALKKFEKLHDNKNMASMLDYLSKIYLKSPNAVLLKYNISPSERLQRAEQLQLKSIALANDSHSIDELVSGYQNLSEIYRVQKNYKKALDAYEHSSLSKDSLLSDDKRQEITRLEMKYQFKKLQDSVTVINDHKESIAKIEIQKQKLVINATMAAGGFLVIAGFGGFILYKRNRNILTQRNEAKLKQQVSDTEMKALRSQMNPHFIFNSLTSISDYIKKNHIGAADDYLVKFAQLMRLILENSEKKEVSLSSDLKALELYMQLESERLNHKFSYEITIDKDIDADNTLIPPLLLQPFVENSIWHGVADKQGYGKISIYIKKEGDMINCIVEDDGIGLQNTKGEKTGKKSLGMKITRARIDILNKTKNANASLLLIPLQQGTRAEVKLPLQLSF